MEIGLYNHNNNFSLTESQHLYYENLLRQALLLVLKEQEGPEPVLKDLNEIEISLVNDETIAQVHHDFMNINGATDVITFQHGEILISTDTAHKQAQEFNQTEEEELFRYMIHGLLHLHGYIDYTPEDRNAMFTVQERLINTLWHPLKNS